MGGIVGSAELDFGLATEAAEALWPFLIVGARIGAGKAVTMGFGVYDVTAEGETVRDESATDVMVVGA
jgi:hypothetical protein